MNDPLRQEINRALQGGVDPNTFEACAASLLQSIYPGLVLVPGGTDFGQDGVVRDDDGPAYPLICTTGQDAIGNLKRNLKTYRDAGGKAKRAVFAMTRPLTGRQRANLHKAAVELGFDLDQIYDHGWFLDQLYFNDVWRLELLGLTGRPSALSEVPRSRRAAPLIPLVGRAPLLDELWQIQGDIVIYGEPGVGKTFLLRELAREGWGQFLVDRDRAALANAIRRQQPRRIIVDDAHFSLDALTELKQLREELGANFTIVATSWPGWIPDVGAHLENRRAFAVERLPRDEILQIVEHLGLMGPVEIQRHIIDQARGRPGLAATLVEVSRRGMLREVVLGKELLRDTLASLSSLIGGADLLTVLGVIALGGETGTNIQTVSRALGRDLPTVSRAVRDVASGGVIDIVSQRPGEQLLIVQPESLRYALVGEVYFGEWPALPIDPILASFPDASVALLPLIGAAHRGARVDHALIRELLTKARHVVALVDYAALGRVEAAFALTLAADTDARGQVAEAALISAPEIGLRTLMEISVGDTRPRHSFPDHGMRRLADYAHQPNQILAHRLNVFTAAKAFLAEGLSPDIAMEAMVLALKPGVGSGSLDPGSGTRFTISRGLVPFDVLEKLAPLWDNVLDVLAACPATDFEPFWETLGDWCWPDRLVFGDVSIAERWSCRSRSEARRVVRELAGRLPNRPGVRARLKQLSRAAKLNVPVEVDPEMEILYPAEERLTGGDAVAQLRRSEKRWSAAARRLADSWASREPEVVAARLAYLEGEAQVAKLRQWPWLAPLVCQTLAEITEEPDRYARALLASGAPVQLLAPFLDRLIVHLPEDGQRLLTELLNNECARLIAILTCLQQPVSGGLLVRAIGVCERANAPIIRDHFRRFTQEAQRALLMHDDITIVQAATSGFAMDEQTQTNGEVYAAWQRAMVRCPADEHWIPRALQAHSELIPAWIDGWIHRAKAHPSLYEHLPEGLLAAVGLLPFDARIQILNRFPQVDMITAGGLVAALVGQDLETTEVVFQRQELKDYQPSVLRGPPDDRWIERARIAQAHGCALQEIVAQAARRPDGIITYRGRESALWATWVECFECLKDGNTELHQALSDAGIAHFSRLRDLALKREAAEAIYGR